jgi:hypothetical protein
MIKIFAIAIIFVIIQNVTCKKSTFCPKVQPMEGFKWQPVRINDFKITKNYYMEKLVFRKLASLYSK